MHAMLCGISTQPTHTPSAAVPSRPPSVASMDDALVVTSVVKHRGPLLSIVIEIEGQQAARHTYGETAVATSLATKVHCEHQHASCQLQHAHRYSTASYPRRRCNEAQPTRRHRVARGQQATSPTHDADTHHGVTAARSIQHTTQRPTSNAPAAAAAASLARASSGRAPLSGVSALRSVADDAHDTRHDASTRKPLV